MDRRNFMSGAGLAVASVALAASAKVPAMQRPLRMLARRTVKVGPKAYPVSQQFEDEVLRPYPDLASATVWQLIAMGNEIGQLSSLRAKYILPRPLGVPMAPGGTLTVAEEARRSAIIHVFNIHTTVNFLEGRSHEEFGFATIDQVHGNEIVKECGCTLRTVHDHHKRGTVEAVPHPHTPLKSCDAHAHMAEDFRAHHATVIADCEAIVAAAEAQAA